MKSISEIFSSYKETLDKTYLEQIENWKQIKEKIKPFYKEFLKNLIINYGKQIEDNHKSFTIKENIKHILKTDNIKFVAIDGSSFKDTFSEFVVFYGGAYAVRGTLKLRENPVKIEYEKWDIKYDKSVVAYVPIPFIELDLQNDLDMFLSTDEEKTDFLSIHNQLMQLAEIYLAYSFIKNPDSDINIILLDNSLSSIYLSNDVLHKLEDLKVVGYRFRRSEITAGDVFTSYAMPINEKLNVPSCKDFHGEFYLIRKLFEKDTCKCECELIKEEKHLKRLKELDIIEKDSTLDNIRINKDFANNTKESWEFIKAFFEYICEEIFVNRNVNILKIEKENGYEWLSSNDIRYLISIGIRMLIEKSWERNVLIVGIAKDSASKYFSKNYLGVMYHLEIYNFNPLKLSISDRLLLETLPFIDNELKAPWSTIEFDSVFMSLHLTKDENENVFIEGFRGDIIVPHERLFLRSLAQFYIDRTKQSPRTGNVIFIDRIAHPDYDTSNTLENKKEKKIFTKRGDVVNPIFYEDKNSLNKIQQSLIFIIDTLTKNLFPNVIGYPDPLHKADWGAKSMNKKVRELIKSSEIKFLSDPLKKSFRDKREEGYKGG